MAAVPSCLMVELLLRPLISVWGASVSLLEAFGFVTGVLCVWLLGREHVWNWPIGNLQVSAYILVFWDAGLPANSLLQLVFLILGFVGWWNWLRRGPGGERVAVRRATMHEWNYLAVAGIAGSVTIWWVVAEGAGTLVAAADSITTTLSLLATYGQTVKLLESWWLWVAADVIYIPLYLAQGLWMTALLYTIYLGLCIEGLRQWRMLHAATPDLELLG